MIAAIAEQQAALTAMIGAHVGAGTRYALIDFPDHPNVGDSAIWLGEVAMLRAATGRDPDYVATWHDFDVEAMRAACPEGVVFLHGGGNLGDIWPHHQRVRERVLAEVRDRPVVQLPQSIHFRDPAGVAPFAALANRHPAFTLYARDRHSQAWMQTHLDAPVLLAPDSAFALGPQARGVADCAVLALLRSDGERCADRASLPRRAVTVDWLEDAPGLPEGDDPRTRTAQAEARVARGLSLLSRGERIVTDRLHGHILATLLGIPHRVLDQEYGKIARYADTWPTAPFVERERFEQGGSA